MANAAISGIMDAIASPGIEQVTVMKSAGSATRRLRTTSSGITSPRSAPVMLVQPTIEDAQGIFKEEIAPMANTTPV